MVLLVNEFSTGKKLKGYPSPIERAREKSLERVPQVVN